MSQKNHTAPVEAAQVLGVCRHKIYHGGATNIIFVYEKFRLKEIGTF